MLIASFVLQAAAQPAPDIQLEINASARRVEIHQEGEASLELRASPDGGTDVRVESPEGSRVYRNVRVRVQADARIADPLDPTVSIRSEASADAPQNDMEPETRRPD